MKKSEFKAIIKDRAADGIVGDRVVDIDIWDSSDGKKEWIGVVITVSRNHVVTKSSYYLAFDNSVRFLDSKVM